MLIDGTGRSTDFALYPDFRIQPLLVCTFSPAVVLLALRTFPTFNFELMPRANNKNYKFGWRQCSGPRGGGRLLRWMWYRHFVFCLLQVVRKTDLFPCAAFIIESSTNHPSSLSFYALACALPGYTFSQMNSWVFLVLLVSYSTFLRLFWAPQCLLGEILWEVCSRLNCTIY